MNTPSLFIVAGPNGSGKSLFSKELTASDYEVFDGDKHMAGLVKKFPETGSEALWSFIDENIFQKEKQKAIQSNLNYAFETNFSSDDPMISAREFKKAGYETHLIYMGVDSLEDSIQRVAYRVRKGGHKVSEESIKHNYEFGLKNFYKHFTEFDFVSLFNNAIPFTDEPIVPQEILYILKGNLHLKTEGYPEWVKPVIEIMLKKK
jgi:predicted ABC-type ATPase